MPAENVALLVTIAQEGDGVFIEPGTTIPGPLPPAEPRHELSDLAQLLPRGALARLDVRV